jgi:hypothetical protein
LRGTAGGIEFRHGSAGMQVPHANEDWQKGRFGRKSRLVGSLTADYNGETLAGMEDASFPNFSC